MSELPCRRFATTTDVGTERGDLERGRAWHGRTRCGRAVHRGQGPSGGTPRGLMSRRPLVAGLVLVATLVASCGGGSTATRSPGSSAARSSGPSGAPGSGLVAPSTVPSSANSFEPATATPSTPAPTAAARLRGHGSQDTSRFRLTVGSYRVAWTISSSSSNGCIQIAALRTANGKVNKEVASASLPGMGSKKGVDSIGITTAGTYYLSVASTCRWAISILPVP
ncbi:MAG TPA: hypothetical protein VNF73_11435 [Candidatus Saccharimonadales bacterium]|nr:hypothetical protein [Candidatus Saccharimonadales bacterium]